MILRDSKCNLIKKEETFILKIKKKRNLYTFSYHLIEDSKYGMKLNKRNHTDLLVNLPNSLNMKLHIDRL
jgi:hypothetical protein